MRLMLRGTPFATLDGMSPVGRALHERFESVCRTELQRLRRKTAALSPEERAEVDDVSVAIAHGIASRLGAALDAAGTEELASVVMRLFAVSAAPVEGHS
jgi:glutamyl-tRNAGlu reductase-like protein